MKNSTAAITGGLIIIGALYFAGGTSDTGSQGNTKTPTMNFPAGSGPDAKGNKGEVASNNSVIKEGVQYVTITARGGYSPRESLAKAGVPTKILMKTDGTYDCSSSLVIRSLGYRGMLPANGETSIDAGTPKSGDTIQGVCGMGMYSFEVIFK